MRLHLAIGAALRAPLLEVGLEVLGERVVVLLLLVDVAHLEEDARGVLRLARAVELHERVHVGDRLVALAEADAEGGRVAERVGRLLLARELAGEVLVVVGRLAVVRELVVAGRDAEERLLRQRILGVVLDQLDARLERLSDEVGVLEALAGVSEALGVLRVIGEGLGGGQHRTAALLEVFLLLVGVPFHVVRVALERRSSACRTPESFMSSGISRNLSTQLTTSLVLPWAFKESSSRLAE